MSEDLIERMRDYGLTDEPGIAVQEASIIDAAAAEIERLRAKLAEAEKNPRDNEEADQRLMEFLVQTIGGHSVTIVREGKRLIGWCAGGKGRSIAMADLRAAAEWMEKGE